MPIRLRATAEFVEKPGLADAGLADNFDRQRTASVERDEEVVEHAELLGAPNEVLGNGHCRV